MPISAGAVIPVPEPDPGATEWYVDPVSGDDGADGTSWETAFATIDTAMGSATPDDVINLAEGDYTADFPIMIDNRFDGLTFRGAGADATVLDAEGVSRHFEVLGAEFTLEDMTLTGGSEAGGTFVLAEPAREGVASGMGGSIGALEATLTVTGCAFESNNASIGGAICADGGSWMRVSDCVFTGNGQVDVIAPLVEVEQPCFEGGAIAVYSSEFLIDSSLFVGNGATLQGAAIMAGDGEGQVTDCLFMENVLIGDGFINQANLAETLVEPSGAPVFGGIVSLNGGMFEVTGCEFRDNLAYGAAVSSRTSQILIEDTKFLDNMLFLGSVFVDGGMFFRSDPADLSAAPAELGTGALINRCLAAGNTESILTFGFVMCDQVHVLNSLAHHNDSAMSTVFFAGVPNAYVVNSTFADNAADYGVSNTAAVGDAALASLPAARVYNSIVWDGRNGSISEGVMADACDLWDWELGDAAPVAMGNISEDPMFVSPEYGNYRLKVGSPCIDTAMDFELAPAGDLDGLSRPVDGNDDTVEAYDMGAYEFFGNASDRIWGPDRYDTAVQISADHFASADTVVLATGRTFADGLAASGLAGLYHAPLLLTDATSLPPVVADEIERLGASRVVVVGGEEAVAGNVASELEAMGLLVERIGGADRYETAAMIADVIMTEAPVESNLVFVARGDLFADALTASPVAFANMAPVLLVRPDEMPPATVDVVETLGADANVVILGGESAVSAPVQGMVESAVATPNVRIDGADRYETSANFSGWAVKNGYATFGVTGVATGLDFPDALSGGAGIGSQAGVLLITPKSSVNPAIDELLTDVGDQIERLQLFGGVNAVSDAVKAQLYGYLP